MNELSVISLNVDKGMLNFDKLMAVKAFCKASDVVLLQETRGFCKETMWKKYLGRQGTFSFFKENARGAAALINQKFDVLQKDNDHQGRVSSILVQRVNQKIGFVSFYCPNVSNTTESKDNYVDTLFEIKRHIINLKKETDLVVASGDLNIILDAALDAEKINATTYPVLVEEVLDLLDSCDLTDAYRFLYPENKAYTFSPKGSNPHNVFRRLDYCFVSEALVPYLEYVGLEHCHFSDHKAVKVKFCFKQSFKLRNFWRHNDTLLDFPEYVDYIKDSIREASKKYIKETNCRNLDNADPRKYWEFLKYYLGRDSRKFSKVMATEEKKVETALNIRLSELEDNPVSNKTELVDVKRSLDLLRIEKDKRIMFQARVAFTEHNEKPTNFFMRKIKENFFESNVIELVKEGEVLSRDDCNKEIYKFYQQLYGHKSASKPGGKLRDILQDLPKLTQAEVEKMQKPVTLSEVTTTLLRDMNTGKSPGSDGLTVAFYKRFWDFLKVPYFKSLEASIQKGELTDSQKRSIIRLIQKKGKDSSQLKNWRPISLMNCDAKIFSRLITGRLESVICNLCSEEQLAYVKGRNITEGNRVIDYMINYMEQSNKEGYVVGFDFEKAFDSVSHEFIRTVLQCNGFPVQFIQLFDTLYKGAESAVMNNGLTTPYFPLERSCRQGDCLSPYLFIIALEPLIRMIKANHEISGFNPINQVIKVSAYADDMTGFVHDEKELSAFIKTIKEFGESSGLQLNMGKTEALHVSQSPKSAFEDEALQGVTFVRHLKVTGIIFGRSEDHILTEKLNFQAALNKIRNNFNSWNQRDLTILGRVMLAKYHGIALLQYLANNIEVPEWVIIAAKKLIYRFIHKGVDKISRKMASRPLSKGGINLPMLDDVVAAAGVQWIRKARSLP